MALDDQKIINALAVLVRKKRWLEIIWFARRQWDKQAWTDSKRNSGAVERIEQAFRMTFGKPAFNAQFDNKYWREQIAKYVVRVGVAAIIDDMKKVAGKYRPVSIVYFLQGKPGFACRWEMLCIDQLNKEIEKIKLSEQEDAKAMREIFGDIFAATVKKVEPGWVLNAKDRLRQIEKLFISGSVGGSELRNLKAEKNTLELRLRKFENELGES